MPDENAGQAANHRSDVSQSHILVVELTKLKLHRKDVA